MRPGLVLALLSQEGLLLISLGVGYIVCAVAMKQEKALKALGLIIGVIIMALSAIIFIAKAHLISNIPIKRAAPVTQQAPVPPTK